MEDKQSKEPVITPIINNLKNPSKKDKLMAKLQELSKSVILTEEISKLIERNRQNFKKAVKPIDDDIDDLLNKFKKDIEVLNKEREKYVLQSMETELEILEHRHDKDIK